MKPLGIWDSEFVFWDLLVVLMKRHTHVHLHFDRNAVQQCGSELPLSHRLNRGGRQLGAIGLHNLYVRDRAVSANRSEKLDVAVRAWIARRDILDLAGRTQVASNAGRHARRTHSFGPPCGRLRESVAALMGAGDGTVVA